MNFKEKINEKDLFKIPRYWYHISTTLKHKRIRLKPRDNDAGFNRNDSEPEVKRTCVGPSISHCFAAVPYDSDDTFNIYRTSRKVKAVRPYDIYDSHITLEGWLLRPVSFIKIGSLSLLYVQNKLGSVIQESASSGSLRRTTKVLKWWQNKDLTRFIRPL
jgi:hypothetical protein